MSSPEGVRGICAPHPVRGEELPPLASARVVVVQVKRLCQHEYGERLRAAEAVAVFGPDARQPCDLGPEAQGPHQDAVQVHLPHRSERPERPVGGGHPPQLHGHVGEWEEGAVRLQVGEGDPGIGRLGRRECPDGGPGQVASLEPGLGPELRGAEVPHPVPLLGDVRDGRGCPVPGGHVGERRHRRRGGEEGRRHDESRHDGPSAGTVCPGAHPFGYRLRRPGS
jgi:hypothetical protein